MDQTQFMGLLIGAIVTLLGVASIIVAIVIKPVINLNRTITKLDATIDSLKEADSILKDRVSEHGHQIDELNIKTANHDILINNQANELTSLRASVNYKHKGK